jgi:heme/copper-type cytochrome/quinol oxidase subunit 2
MKATMIVQTPEDFDAWVKQNAPQPAPAAAPAPAPAPATAPAK